VAEAAVLKCDRGRKPQRLYQGNGAYMEGILEDTIFVPYTFGPIQKMAEELGTPYYEAANILLDDRYYDNLSGQQAYKCFLSCEESIGKKKARNGSDSISSNTFRKVDSPLTKKANYSFTN